MFSYEVAMGLTLIGIMMVFESVRLGDIVAGQGEWLWEGVVRKWGILVQPLGFILFFTAAVAETKRAPFDIPEGESEIIGYFVEYSSMRFAIFMLSEFMEIVVTAALITVIFLGGYNAPFLFSDGIHLPTLGVIHLPEIVVILLQVCTFIFKVVFLCWLQLQIRWTLPRFRFDQLMNLGWKIILPASLINILLTGFILLLIGK